MVKYTYNIGEVFYMKNREYRVHFEPITPLWFGNAWMKNDAPIKTSSLMGSLRFWFEVICYISGMTTNEDYDTNNNQKTILKANLDQKGFQMNLIEKLNGKTTKNKEMDNLIHEVLTAMKVPLPARVFGCTGWQGLIKVKTVEIKEIKRKPALSSPIGISKKDPKAQILRNFACPKKSDKDISVHYFPNPKLSFYSNFDVIFATDEKTAQHILFPLLKFIENYGFLGRGWKSGYGRVKVYFEEKEKQYDRFANYLEFTDTPVKFSDLIEKVNTEKDMWLKENNRIKILVRGETENNNVDINEIMEELVKEKTYLRRKINDSEKRHQVFGTTKPPSQGSKILPWLYEDSEKLKYGFISIFDIFNIGEKERGESNEF